MLQCALEFAKRGPVSSEPTADPQSNDSSTLAAESTAMSVGLHFTPAVGVMDVDMESPRSLNRFEKIEQLP